jgi:hypothetical protein
VSLVQEIHGYTALMIKSRVTRNRASQVLARNMAGYLTYQELAAWPIALAHLDILLEAMYPHLGCLLKNNENASNCCRAPSTC